MKKLLFTAVLSTVTTLGFAKSSDILGSDIENAKSGSIKKESTVKSQTKESKSKATTAVVRAECRTVVVSCTSAYTCQNWSEDQWNTWGTNIQSNYCMYDSPYTP